VKTQTHEYDDGNESCEGYLVTHEDGKVRPGVIISHAWAGLGDFEQEKAKAVAELGYNVLAIDMYGKGIRGTSIAENQKLMGRFINDRALLRQRITCGLNTLKALDIVDSNRTAAMGYCFGGLCVLDLARSGAEVTGVISIHGIFTPPQDLPNELIKAKVLALHGYDDPMATPENLIAFGTEMTEAGVDWQVHAYGLTYHAFTNPEANDAGMGTVFNPKANKRSWRALVNFLSEIFE
jgi:dienelactone hydrolase